MRGVSRHPGAGPPAGVRLESVAVGVRLWCGEALELLRALPAAEFDALVTDPPYSSGGFTRGDRAAPAKRKYEHTGTVNGHTDFAGDNRDALAWGYWCTLWLSEARRVVRPGGYALVFCDWRQLAAACQVLQAGGWVHRGVVVWDKGGAARAPHKGYFRHQAEFVVWGSNGPLPVAPSDDARGGPWPGVIHCPVVATEKDHMTAKPVRLMRELVKCVPPGGQVLDLFGGSGTTAQACQIEGRRCVVAEADAAHAATIRKRVGRTAGRGSLFDPAAGG